MPFSLGLSSIPWLISAAVGIALGVFVMLYRTDEAALLQKEHAIANLQGAIQNQNTSIEDYRALAIQVQSRAAAAQKASQARAAMDKATIADLLARPLAATPEASCKAADDAILEFAK